MKKPNKEIINDIDYDKVYKSVDGEFIFLRNTINICLTAINVDVMFLCTGFVKTVNLECAFNGEITDTILKYFYREYYTKNGEQIKLLRFSHRDINNNIYVMIKFMTYEYECAVPLYTLVYGNIRNPFYRSLYGVGYLGLARQHIDKEYKCWKNMLGRCYNVKNQRYNTYGAVGVQYAKDDIVLLIF